MEPAAARGQKRRFSQDSSSHAIASLHEGFEGLDGGHFDGAQFDGAHSISPSAYADAFSADALASTSIDLSARSFGSGSAPPGAGRLPPPPPLISSALSSALSGSLVNSLVNGGTLSGANLSGLTRSAPANPFDSSFRSDAMLTSGAGFGAVGLSVPTITKKRPAPRPISSLPPSTLSASALRGDLGLGSGLSGLSERLSGLDRVLPGGMTAGLSGSLAGGDLSFDDELFAPLVGGHGASKQQKV